jgi:two-component system chemotaxis response regulator CheB
MSERSKPISILVAEDSATQRQFLLSLLEEAGGFDIVGVATDGLEAVEATGRLRPDIVLMDCHMPHATGIEATRVIMDKFPTPIVIVSSTLTRDEIDRTFDAIKCGALAFLPKPTLAAFESQPDGDSLIQTLRLMAEVKVVGRRVRPAMPRRSPQVAKPAGIGMIGVGGSTGAPGVIAEILSGVDAKSTVPILIVQHMARGFVEGFAQWLSNTTRFPVSVGAQGTAVQPGHAYLCPDDRHMGIDAGGRIALSDSGPEEGFRPSANFLFRSISQSFGRGAMGVLLTGMGRDGAAGLLALRRAGGLTVAQDEASCVVYGMPREAVALGAVQHVLPPAEIARVIAGISANARA